MTGSWISTDCSGIQWLHVVFQLLWWNRTVKSNNTVKNERFLWCEFPVIWLVSSWTGVDWTLLKEAALEQVSCAAQLTMVIFLSSSKQTLWYQKTSTCRVWLLHINEGLSHLSQYQTSSLLNCSIPHFRGDTRITKLDICTKTEIIH